MQHHILSIGISHHQNPKADLSWAARDVAEIFALFQANIGDLGYQRLLRDSEATLAQIKTALGRELAAAVKPGDVFFFFYSGHGVSDVDPNDPNAAANYLVPFDATDDFANSCISVVDLQHAFKALPAAAKFVFVDSCFSGCVAKNTKGYPAAKRKAFKSIKTIANTVTGKGTLTPAKQPQ